MQSTDGLDTCGTCHTSIRWTVTASGARMAVTPDPDPTGNAAVYCDGTGTWRSRRPTAEYPVLSYEYLARPHVADCTRPQPSTPRPRRAGRPSDLPMRTWGPR